jgi:hypothetical protein
MTLDKGMIPAMALKDTGELAGNSHDTGERDDTSHGTREYWTKG